MNQFEHTSGSRSLKTERRQIGGLNCHIVRQEEADNPEVLCVLLHGFGAPGTDLVPLAGELFRIAPQLPRQVVFAFPEAPLDLSSLGMPGSRAWWMIDVARINQMIERGELRDLRDEEPAGVPEARQLLQDCVKELRREFAPAGTQLVLGGFSQGSMLAADVALRLEEPPAGLIVWSGTVISEQTWKELAKSRSGLPVVISHGRQDPILPFQGAVWLKELLEQAGCNVTFLPFDGPHTISGEAILRTAELLRDAAKVR